MKYIRLNNDVFERLDVDKLLINIMATSVLQQ